MKLHFSVFAVSLCDSMADTFKAWIISLEGAVATARYRKRQAPGTILTFKRPVDFRLVSAANIFRAQFVNIFKMLYFF
jgi:hypothetical protein